MMRLGGLLGGLLGDPEQQATFDWPTASLDSPTAKGDPLFSVDD
jgi:hypothetical protein